MSWDNNDFNGFNNSCVKNIGQISINHYLGKYIFELCKNDDLNSFLEIGTWNGLGSTKCFVDGVRARTNPYIFYSLECNSDKCEFAKKIYSDIPNVNILNEVLLTDIPDDINIIFPELMQNENFKYWNSIDFENMKNKKLFFERQNLPKIFDVVLLDGGEFTTWYEYLIIKDKCKILLLDDTNTLKCNKIKEDLLNNNQWEIIFINNERNGTMAVKNKLYI
jgi:hypothetical protein